MHKIGLLDEGQGVFGGPSRRGGDCRAKDSDAAVWILEGDGPFQASFIQPMALKKRAPHEVREGLRQKAFISELLRLAQGSFCVPLGVCDTPQIYEHNGQPDADLSAYSPVVRAIAERALEERGGLDTAVAMAVNRPQQEKRLATNWTRL